MKRADKGGAWGLAQQMADEVDYKLEAIRREHKSDKAVMDVIERKWKGCPQDLLDPDFNLILSIWQLGHLRKTFGDDFFTVAAAYHQGPNAVLGRLRAGKPVVSRLNHPMGYDYVRKAVSHQQSVQQLFGPL